jgi:hypothetical protein
MEHGDSVFHSVIFNQPVIHTHIMQIISRCYRIHGTATAVEQFKLLQCQGGASFTSVHHRYSACVVFDNVDLIYIETRCIGTISSGGEYSAKIVAEQMEKFLAEFRHALDARPFDVGVTTPSGSQSEPNVISE